MVSTIELASLRGFTSSDRHPVVSLYLNVNGAHFPTRADYETEFSILVNNARKAAAGDLHLTRDQESGLDNDLRAISEYLTLEFKRNGERGLVIYSCGAEGLWEMIPMRVPIENRLFVDFKPQVAPLMEVLSSYQRICVLVTDQKTARILKVHAGEIAEQPGIMDAVLKHHTQGGWEQTKLQRRHDKQVREHLKHAADATLDYFKQEHFDRIAIGISDELWPELEKVLHPYLRERLEGRFSLDIDATTDEVMAKVTLMEETHRNKDRESMLESLGPELDAGKVFVGGLDDVLQMLNQRRVDLLLVEEGYHTAGRHCPACNTLEHGEKICPTCGQSVDQVKDVVEAAMELAVRQDALVKTIPLGHPAMTQAEHIAARLRY